MKMRLSWDVANHNADEAEYPDEQQGIIIRTRKHKTAEKTDILTKFIVGQGQSAWEIAGNFLDQKNLCPALVKRTRFWEYVVNILLILASAVLSEFFLNGRFLHMVPDLFRDGRLEDTFPLTIEYGGGCRWGWGGSPRRKGRCVSSRTIDVDGTASVFVKKGQSRCHVEEGDVDLKLSDSQPLKVCVTGKQVSVDHQETIRELEETIKKLRARLRNSLFEKLKSSDLTIEDRKVDKIIEEVENELFGKSGEAP